MYCHSILQKMQQYHKKSLTTKLPGFLIFFTPNLFYPYFLNAIHGYILPDILLGIQYK